MTRYEGNAWCRSLVGQSAASLGMTILIGLSGALFAFVVQGIGLVHFAAVVADGRFAEIANFDVRRAEVLEAFGAPLVSFV